MKTRFSAILLVSFFFTLATAFPALAHNTWLNPETYFPNVGETIDIGIGFGHTYPANRVDQTVKENHIKEIKAVDPDGVIIDLEKVSAAQYRLKIEKPGAYRVIAQTKPGFFTITPEGRKWGNKKEVSNPVKCTNFYIQAKTLIIAGGKNHNFDGVADQPLEVIPLTDILSMKPGDAFSFKLLFEGKPLSGVSVKATYAGFQAEAAEASQPAGKAQAPPPFPAETLTDEQGMGTVQLSQPGYWMILASWRSPFADPQICDECMYNMAFTFEVPK